MLSLKICLTYVESSMEIARSKNSVLYLKCVFYPFDFLIIWLFLIRRNAHHIKTAMGVVILISSHQVMGCGANDLRLLVLGNHLKHITIVFSATLFYLNK